MSIVRPLAGLAIGRLLVSAALFHFAEYAFALHRWHELECGTGNDSGSWVVVRGRKDGGEFISDDDGKPFIAHHPPQGKTRYSPIADREGGALKRLAKIMSRYPGYQAYVQTKRA